MNFCYIEHYCASVGVYFDANSNISTGYAFIPLDMSFHELLVAILNATVQVMLERTNSYISIGYTKNTIIYSNILRLLILNYFSKAKYLFGP